MNYQIIANFPVYPILFCLSEPVEEAAEEEGEKVEGMDVDATPTCKLF